MSTAANRKKRVEAKVQLYLTEGVTEVWLVSPKRKTVDVIRRDNIKVRREYSVEESIQLPLPLSGQLAVSRVFDLQG